MVASMARRVAKYSVPQTSHDLCLKIEFLTTTSSNSLRSRLEHENEITEYVP